MKKLMIASLGLSLLTGTAMFAQDTAGSSGDTMSSKTKTKKKKKSKGGAETGATSSSTTSTSK